MIPSDDQVKGFLDAIESAKSVLISTHLNPGGDALGSALALSHYLDSIGKPNEVICNNSAPYNLEFLPGVDRVTLEPKGKHDLAVILDLDALNRLGRTRPFIEECPHLIVIDHHVPHEQPGHDRIVDVDASATAVILARLLNRAGAKLNKSMAQCLLAGIVTDTGAFRYRNTTAESLTLAAQLLESGGDIVEVCEEVYQRKPLPGVRLLGKCLDHMVLENKDKLAHSVLRASDFAQTGAKEENTEGLVNELLFIRTVKIATVIRQPEEGKLVRASIRSRGQYDVANAVRPFGGGGHRNAAGCTFECDIDEATRLLMEALRQCLASSS